MNYLITGGTGFIGSRLALDLAKRGANVRVLAQTNTPAEVQNCEELEQRGVEVIEASVGDTDRLRQGFRGIDVVYHLAAAQHQAHMSDQHFYHVNVEGTRNVLHAAVETGVQRFVHGSTIGVYGVSRNGPVHDHSALRPDNIYGVTKLEGEKTVWQFADKVAVTVVRISEAYGPGDHRLLKLFRSIARKRYFHIGDGTNLHHLVYIDDLIAGLRSAASSSSAINETFVLAGPRAITTDQMIADICKALHVAPPRVRVPIWPFLIAATVSERTLRPLGVRMPLHRRRLNFFIGSFQFDCEAAKRLLSYEPVVEFDAGARRTAEWYEQRRLLQWWTDPGCETIHSNQVL